MQTELLKCGNHKLSKSIGIFTLPRTTCIGKGECDSFCYAKIFETMPSVINYRNHKLKISKYKSFESLMAKAIENSNFKKIRLHESGDFYNQIYLDKWKRITAKFPNIKFLAYTKALDLDLWSNLPKNFIIFQSYGGNKDYLIDNSKPTARVIGNAKDITLNEFLCKYGQSNFKKCGETCNYCYSNIKNKHVAFVLHKKLRSK